MANGAGSSDCWNCRFVITTGDRKECSKHSFIIPKLNQEKLCADWQSNKDHSTHHFRNLLHGILYYYSYASNQPPAPLDQFEYFKKQIEYISLTLVYDTEFGWSIYCVNENKGIQYDVQETVTLILDGSRLSFEVAEATRLFYGLSEQNDGRGWSKGIQKIIYYPSDPVILYKWLNKQFDVEAILYKFSHARSMLYSPIVNLFILCESDRSENTLRLKPHIPLYGELARDHNGRSAATG